MRDNCDRLGVTFEAIRMDAGLHQLRKGPERDRELESILGNIEKASQAGVKIITYHWTVIPIRRNLQTPGRGGVTYAGFKLEDNWKDLPVENPAGSLPTITGSASPTFSGQAVPVAKQYDVRLACHPYDPPGLPFGYQGADNWDSPSVFEAIKRYEAIVDSPYNGFQLCLGTVGGGLKNPRTEILPIVDTWASAARSTRSTCATSAAGCTIRGSLSRRRRDGLLPGHAHPAGHAVRRLDLSRPHAAPPGRSRQAAGVRVRLRLHQGADPGREFRSMRS